MILAGIAFALLSALALAGLVANRVPWQAKLVVIALVPAYGFLLWHAFSSQAGWPVATHLPKQALLVSSVVQEPTAIYVWLIPEPPARLPFDYRPSDGEPRAYRIPYSRRQAAALQAAAAAQKRGARIGVSLVHGDGSHIPRTFFRPYDFRASLPSKEAP